LWITFLILVLPASAMSAQDWDRLGSREVDFKTDRDTIEVGSKGGPYKQLRLVVKGAPIELYDMVVTFGNGEKFKPELRRRFDEGSTSHVIDLPGDKRNIRRIDFRYRSINKREGKAVVTVDAR
jgi:hypothetical protein